MVLSVVTTNCWWGYSRNYIFKHGAQSSRNALLTRK